MSGTGNRLIGGVFGDTNPSTAYDGSISGVYTMPDQYYMTQEGGWELQSGHVATGGAISDYSDPTATYRAHIYLKSFWKVGKFILYSFKFCENLLRVLISAKF